MPTWFFLLCQFSIIATALLGGVFLTFSDFIMRSLQLSPGGAEVMQTINIEVFRFVFMTLFIGMAPISLILVGYGIFGLEGSAALLIILAAAMYLLGVFGVTVAFNVPLNEALAKLEPGSAALGEFWTGTYLPRWTFWNSVRAWGSVGASALLLAALVWAAQSRAA